MAGGPTTVELIEAVTGAGALGFIPGGSLTADAFRDLIDVVSARARGPWGVNLFLPGPAAPDPGAIGNYANQLKPWEKRFGVSLGDPVRDDDTIETKLEILAGYEPAAVSFTFGNPGTELVSRVHETTGAAVITTVTTPEEAAAAAGTGVNGLVVQGSEAGGHRGVWMDDRIYPGGGPLIPLLDLIEGVLAVTDLLLIASGGLMNGHDSRRALDAGASAVQLGTAFLCTPEAGTPEVHRRALLDNEFPGTTVTRGFTGRPARGLANPLAVAFPDAPSGYPEVDHLTRPIRAAAAKEGDSASLDLWAGRGWRKVTEEPAADLVARIAAEAGIRT